jgi:hypothetical protein
LTSLLGRWSTPVKVKHTRLHPNPDREQAGKHNHIIIIISSIWRHLARTHRLVRPNNVSENLNEFVFDFLRHHAPAAVPCGIKVTSIVGWL